MVWADNLGKVTSGGSLQLLGHGLTNIHIRAGFR
jgi:hypothetical protein